MPPDGITLNSGAGGATLATDEIGGAHHQRVKVEFGVDGAANDVSGTNPLPVVESSSSAARSNVAAAAADTLILSANSARRCATFYNDSSANLRLAYGAGAASNSSFSVLIGAGGYHEIPDGYTGEVRGIWEAANGAVRVTEFTT